MAEPEIDLSDFDALRAILARIPDLALQAAEAGMEEATLWLQGEISALASSYPPPPSPGGHYLKNMGPKAQAWFFWAVKKGKVPGWKWVKDEHGGHPEGAYVRTGNLGRSITHSVKRDGDEVIGQVGSNLNYAPWVIGPDFPGEEFTFDGKTGIMYQASIHAGRWFQFEPEVEQRLPQAQEEFETKFFEVLAKLANEQY